MKLNRQRGQALTEFLVAAVAVLPLFLLVPLIAKYQDISNSTQAAARYVAFQATVRNDITSTWEPESQLAEEVVRRFFSNPDAPIKTNDAAGNFKAHQNLFWRDPIDRPLIGDFASDVRLTFGPDASPTQAGAFTSAADGAPTFTGHELLELKARGIYMARVSVKLANVPSGLKFYEPFDSINLSMTRGTSVLIDPWTAKDPAQVESKIAGNAAIFPAGKLAAVSPAVDAAVSIVDAPGGISGPKLGKLDFWRDVVPEDRLRSRN
jgi:hypothetical protein